MQTSLQALDFDVNQMKTIALLLLLPAVALGQTADRTFKDPVDGTEYHADWKTYQPKDGIKERADRAVQIGSARLLSTQEEFEKNLSVKTLADFMKATHANIEFSIGIPSSNFELLVNTTLSKDHDPAFEIASQGEVANELLQKIHDGLSKMKGLKTKSDTIKYQTHYIIKRSQHNDEASFEREPARPHKDRP